jgi:Right handed beta helix region
MPGIYTEPTSRGKPTNDSSCDQYETNGDRPNETGALSYTYQFNCPNDQNLIAVIGREPGTGEDPSPPRYDRHGIPNLGPCIRCNLQVEGSGVSPSDVVIDSGDRSKRNGGPSGVGSEKDVAIRADRADGFVLRNVTVRHAKEHGIYVHETDGYLLDRFKAFYNGLYGTLTFASDHGVQQNCETVGHGDSGIYPGGAPETGTQRPDGTPFRYNQEIRQCDLHHNLAGYSGTNGNAVHLHDNEIYDNALGIQTDVVTGAGHPGYPGDSALFENNDIYSNNFNPYDPGGDVIASFPFPVGTGAWIAGGNNHTVRNNRIWDNWRRGTMLFAVPDSLICGPAADGNEQAGCEPGSFSTSHNNSYYGNVMGIAPDGRAEPNGLDFWWDSFPGNRGNCWYDNSGAAPITTSPSPLPDCDGGRNPDSSMGTGNSENEGELVTCFVAFETDNFDPSSSPCPWFDSPPKPGSAAASSAAQAEQRARQRQAFIDFCQQGPAPTCEPFNLP